MRPLFKKAAELGVYVYLHPYLTEWKETSGYGFTVAGPALGFTLDGIATITRMILSGLFDEIPNLKVVLGHLGEAIPFLLDRMDNRLIFLPNPLVKAKKPFRYYFENNIMVTTSGNMSKEAFACAKAVFGMDHIMFATDYPFEALGPMVDFLDEVPLTQTEREMMFWKNAVEKLGIKRPEQNPS
jgi:predicted TIM-barrel fold metal-dependent hydrolase